MTRVIDWLLTTDRHQRVRLAQSALASLLMLACVLAMHVATAAGLNDGRWLWPWTTVSLLALVLMFGMFGLTQAQVLFVGSYSLLLFGEVMAAMSRQEPQHYPPQVEVVYFLLSAIVVCGVIVLSSRLATMRERLRTQRHELELAVVRIGELATHDELTGLINRRRMQELLERDRRRRHRAGAPAPAPARDRRAGAGERPRAARHLFRRADAAHRRRDGGADARARRPCALRGQGARPQPDRYRMSASARSLSWLLTQHPHGRVRLLQASLAALLMLASVGVMHYGAALGVVDRPQLGWWTLVSLGGSLPSSP